MRRGNIIYMYNGIPYPSQPTLCKVLNISPTAFRVRIYRAGGIGNLSSIQVKGETIDFIKYD